MRSLTIGILTTGILFGASAGAAHPGPAAPVASLPAFGEKLASGRFAGADGHETEGTATIVRSNGRAYLELSGFRTDRGPDLQVWLSTTTVTTAGDARSAEAIVLGRLGGARRDTQRYEIPEGTDPEALRSAVIWCRAFGVLFGTAQLA